MVFQPWGSVLDEHDSVDDQSHSSFSCYLTVDASFMHISPASIILLIYYPTDALQYVSFVWEVFSRWSVLCVPSPDCSHGDAVDWEQPSLPQGKGEETCVDMQIFSRKIHSAVSLPWPRSARIKQKCHKYVTYNMVCPTECEFLLKSAGQWIVQGQPVARWLRYIPGTQKVPV